MTCPFFSGLNESEKQFNCVALFLLRPKQWRGGGGVSDHGVGSVCPSDSRCLKFFIGMYLGKIFDEFLPYLVQMI